jgi:hypothetical protein
MNFANFQSSQLPKPTSHMCPIQVPTGTNLEQWTPKLQPGMEDAHGNIPGGYFTFFVSASAPETRKKKSLTYENNYNFKTSDKGSSGKV